MLVLALVAAIVPLLVGHGGCSCSAEEHGDTGEGLELHDG